MSGWLNIPWGTTRARIKPDLWASEYKPKKGRYRRSMGGRSKKKFLI